MNKVLVTGGAGYLGSFVVRQLLRKKYRVTVLDNLSYGDKGIRDLLGYKRLCFVRGDICNIKDVVKAAKGNDAIIALAAIVGDPACALDKTETLSTNYEATKVLVEIAKYYGIERLVFASSCSVYGSNSNVWLNEGSWVNPVSLYAQTRVMSEEILLGSGSAVVPVILRLSTLFGQSRRMRYDLVINTLVGKAVREGKIQVFGGTQWRPFVHVQDAATAFLAVLEAKKDLIRNEIFNVGGNTLNLTIAHAAELVRRRIPGIEVEMRDEIADRRDYRVAFDKIRVLLGFSPSRTIIGGIGEMARVLQADPDLNYLDNIYYNVRYLYKGLVK